MLAMMILYAGSTLPPLMRNSWTGFAASRP
jgi:hypothetical protein